MINHCQIIFFVNSVWLLYFTLRWVVSWFQRLNYFYLWLVHILQNNSFRWNDNNYFFSRMLRSPITISLYYIVSYRLKRVCTQRALRSRCGHLRRANHKSTTHHQGDLHIKHLCNYTNARQLYDNMLVITTTDYCYYYCFLMTERTLLVDITGSGRNRQLYIIAYIAGPTWTASTLTHTHTHSYSHTHSKSVARVI